MMSMKEIRERLGIACDYGYFGFEEKMHGELLHLWLELTNAEKSEAEMCKDVLEIEYEYHGQMKRGAFFLDYKDRPEFKDTVFVIGLPDYSIILGTISEKGWKDAREAKKVFDKINEMLSVKFEEGE